MILWFCFLPWDTAEREFNMLRYATLTLVVLICALAPAIALADSHDPQRIMVEDVMSKMTAGEDVLFLDTRNSKDWENAKRMIPDAIRVGNSEILTRIAKETPKDRLIVTYCT